MDAVIERQRRKNAVITKILSRIVWHPAWHTGYPVRFRVRSNIRTPTIRFNGRWIDVRLPPEFGRFIKILVKLVRQLRVAYSGNGKQKTSLKTRRKPKAATFEDVKSMTSTLANIAKKEVTKLEHPNGKNGRQKPDSKQNGSPKDDQQLLSIGCLCGRVVQVPPEWISFARCSACGTFLSEVTRNGSTSK